MSLLTNLVSYWKLDEASGNALDAHGSNTLTDNASVGSAAGKINNARDFESSTHQYFSIADNAALSTGDIDFTFACWVKAESLVNYPVILGKWGTYAGYREFVLYYDTSSFRFQFAVESSGGTLASAVANTFGAASTGTWYFVVGWHDSVNNLVGISINAGTADTVSHTLGVRDSTLQFQIGGSNQNVQSLFWDGLIDEVGFWKRVLTSQERTDLYNGGSALSYDDFGGASAGPVLRNRLMTPGRIFGGSVLA